MVKCNGVLQVDRKDCIAGKIELKEALLIGRVVALPRTQQGNGEF